MTLRASLILSLFAAGCGQAPGPVEKPSPPPAQVLKPLTPEPIPTTTVATPKTETPPAEVELKTIKFPQYLEALAALRGKIVVVDIWAEY